MKNLLNKLSNNFDICPPATENAIKACEEHFNFLFSSDYKDFLLFSNGLEGETKDHYLVIWSIDELVELNEAYHVKDFIQDIMLFGSDGAEDAYAFDITDGKIIRLPFIGMGHIPSQKVADTFEQFLSSQIKGNKSFLNHLFK